MWFLLGVLLIISFITLGYIYIKNQVKKILGSDLQDIIKQARLEDEELPKSVSNMDSIYLESLLKDFPEININEIKRLAETNILDILNAIELKDTTKLKGKMKVLADTKIEDSKELNYNNIKFHKTVLSKYQRNKEIATVIIGCSFEYMLNDKKIQDRAKVEFIYVIDEQKIDPNKKLVGLNCPNCGSPIKTLADKHCSYCKTGIKDLVKKSWTCNDVTFY